MGSELASVALEGDKNITARGRSAASKGKAAKSQANAKRTSGAVSITESDPSAQAAGF